MDLTSGSFISSESPPPPSEIENRKSIQNSWRWSNRGLVVQLGCFFIFWKTRGEGRVKKEDEFLPCSCEDCQQQQKRQPSSRSGRSSPRGETHGRGLQLPEESLDLILCGRSCGELPLSYYFYCGGGREPPGRPINYDGQHRSARAAAPREGAHHTHLK